MWHQWWSFYQTLWQKKRLQVIINFPHLVIMNRKIKQCWSSIPLITTKRTIASYLNWTHWTRTETTIYDVTNQGLCLGQAQNVTELNRLMGSQPNHLDNWISNCNAYTMYKQTIKKTCTDSVPLKNMSTAHACVWSLYFTTHKSNSSLYSDILQVAIFWVLTCKLRILSYRVSSFSEDIQPLLKSILSLAYILREMEFAIRFGF